MQRHRHPPLLAPPSAGNKNCSTTTLFNFCTLTTIRKTTPTTMITTKITTAIITTTMTARLLPHLDKEDAKGVDDAEDDAVDEKRTDHNKPGLSTDEMTLTK